jgi:hypothetical protein
MIYDQRIGKNEYRTVVWGEDLLAQNAITEASILKTFEAGKIYFRKVGKDKFEYKIEDRDKDFVSINGSKYPVKNYQNDTEFVVLKDAIAPIGGDVILLFAENEV